MVILGMFTGFDRNSPGFASTSQLIRIIGEIRARTVREEETLTYRLPDAV